MTRQTSSTRQTLRALLAQGLVLACLIVQIPPEQVLRVIDGDTFILMTFDVPPETRVRVLGVDTPERGEPGYAEAGAFTRQWLARGPFTVTTCERDSLLRRLGTVERNGVGLHTELLGAGHGVPRAHR